jgi:hypothetical protein
MDPTDLTHWVQGARRGLRRDVADLVQRLEHGELFVPLAKQVPGAPIGEQMELDDDLTPPHLLADEEDRLFCSMFTCRTSRAGGRAARLAHRRARSSTARCPPGRLDLARRSSTRST